MYLGVLLSRGIENFDTKKCEPRRSNRSPAPGSPLQAVFSAPEHDSNTSARAGEYHISTSKTCAQRCKSETIGMLQFFSIAKQCATSRSVYHSAHCLLFCVFHLQGSSAFRCLCLLLDNFILLLSFALSSTATATAAAAFRAQKHGVWVGVKTVGLCFREANTGRVKPALARLATQIESFVRLLAHAIQLLVLSCTMIMVMMNIVISFVRGPIRMHGHVQKKVGTGVAHNLLSRRIFKEVHHHHHRTWQF